MLGWIRTTDKRLSSVSVHGTVVGYSSGFLNRAMAPRSCPAIGKSQRKASKGADVAVGREFKTQTVQNILIKNSDKGEAQGIKCANERT
jgi:hypothetical protein